MTAKDDLEARADELVDFASVSATALHTALSNQFPVVLNVPLARWNFIVTIAGVFVAIMRLKNMNLPAERETNLLGRVDRHLIRFNKDSVGGLDDCKAFFERTYQARASSDTHDRKFAASDTAGMWIAWNTIGHGADQELRFIRIAGAMVAREFAVWWTGK